MYYRDCQQTNITTKHDYDILKFYRIKSHKKKMKMTYGYYYYLNFDRFIVNINRSFWHKLFCVQKNYLFNTWQIKINFIFIFGNWGMLLKYIISNVCEVFRIEISKINCCSYFWIGNKRLLLTGIQINSNKNKS